MAMETIPLTHAEAQRAHDENNHYENIQRSGFDVPTHDWRLCTAGRCQRARMLMEEARTLWSTPGAAACPTCRRVYAKGEAPA